MSISRAPNFLLEYGEIQLIWRMKGDESIEEGGDGGYLLTFVMREYAGAYKYMLVPPPQCPQIHP